MRRLKLAALFLGIAAPAFAAIQPWQGCYPDTTTAREFCNISGVYSFAASTPTASTSTIVLDGGAGSLRASSATLVYGIRATTGVFTSSVGVAGNFTVGSTITISGDALSVGISTFVISGGSATLAYGFTAGTLTGALDGSNIVAGTVDTSKLKSDSVTNAKVLNATLALSKLAGSPAAPSNLTNTSALVYDGSAWGVIEATALNLINTLMARDLNGNFAANNASLTYGVGAATGAFTGNVGISGVLTVNSTETVTGNAFSVGTSTLNINGGFLWSGTTNTFNGNGSSSTFQGHVAISSGYLVNGVLPTDQGNGTLWVNGLTTTTFLAVTGSGINSCAAPMIQLGSLRTTGISMNGGATGSINICNSGSTSMVLTATGLQGGNGGSMVLSNVSYSTIAVVHSLLNDTRSGLGGFHGKQGEIILVSTGTILYEQDCGATPSTSPTNCQITFPSGQAPFGNLNAITQTTVTFQTSRFSVGGSTFVIQDSSVGIKTTAANLVSSSAFTVGGSASFTGNITAASVAGDGSNLTALNGANLTTLTVDTGKLAADAVDTAKIRNFSVTLNKIDVSAGSAGQVLTISGSKASWATPAASATSFTDSATYTASADYAFTFPSTTHLDCTLTATHNTNASYEYLNFNGLTGEHMKQRAQSNDTATPSNTVNSNSNDTGGMVMSGASANSMIAAAGTINAHFILDNSGAKFTSYHVDSRYSSDDATNEETFVADMSDAYTTAFTQLNIKTGAGTATGTIWCIRSTFN